MTDPKKSSKFGLGVLVGTIVGGLTAFFLSPKSGPENRQMVLKKAKQLKKEIEGLDLDKQVREIWGTVSEDGKKTFVKARKNVLKQLDVLMDKWENFDYDKYVDMVGKSVDEAKTGAKDSAEKLKKLKDLFVRDWNKVFGDKG